MPTVPSRKRSVNQNVFTWAVPGSTKTINIKSMEVMTMAEIEAIETYRMADFYALAKTATDRETMKALPRRDFRAFINAWANEDTTPRGKS